MQGLAFFISSGSAQRRRRSSRRVFSCVPGTRAVDRSLDCILQNPTDGRENVTLITSEKNRLPRKPKQKSFSSITGRDSQPRWSGPLTATPLRLPQAALRKRCPKPEHLLAQKVGDEEPTPEGKDRTAPRSVCSRSEAAG